MNRPAGVGGRSKKKAENSPIITRSSIILRSAGLISLDGARLLSCIEVMDVSNNKLTDFFGLQTLARLRVLLAANNNIATFTGLAYQPALEIIDLSQNPINNYKHMRVMALVCAGEGLKVINGKSVTEAERFRCRQHGGFNSALGRCLSLGMRLEDVKDFELAADDGAYRDMTPALEESFAALVARAQGSRSNNRLICYLDSLRVEENPPGPAPAEQPVSFRPFTPPASLVDRPPWDYTPAHPDDPEGTFDADGFLTIAPVDRGGPVRFLPAIRDIYKQGNTIKGSATDVARAAERDTAAGIKHTAEALEGTLVEPPSIVPYVSTTTQARMINNYQSLSQTTDKVEDGDSKDKGLFKEFLAFKRRLENFKNRRNSSNEAVVANDLPEYSDGIIDLSHYSINTQTQFKFFLAENPDATVRQQRDFLEEAEKEQWRKHYQSNSPPRTLALTRMLSGDDADKGRPSPQRPPGELSELSPYRQVVSQTPRFNLFYDPLGEGSPRVNAPPSPAQTTAIQANALEAGVYNSITLTPCNITIRANPPPGGPAPPVEVLEDIILTVGGTPPSMLISMKLQPQGEGAARPEGPGNAAVKDSRPVANIPFDDVTEIEMLTGPNRVEPGPSGHPKRFATNINFSYGARVSLSKGATLDIIPIVRPNPNNTAHINQRVCLMSARGVFKALMLYKCTAAELGYLYSQ